MKTRRISVLWTQRNVDRMTRLFHMQHDWKGHFTSTRGNGYKLASKDNTRLIFIFTKGSHP